MNQTCLNLPEFTFLNEKNLHVSLLKSTASFSFCVFLFGGVDIVFSFEVRVSCTELDSCVLDVSCVAAC